MPAQLDLSHKPRPVAPGLLVVFMVFATAAFPGCASETSDVRARFIASREQCKGEVKVVPREDTSSVPDDAPDREKLRARLAASKPGYDHYDVHGCGGGAVFECYDQIAYNEGGGSSKVRHCAVMAEWGKVSAAEVAAATTVQYEATDGSTRNAPDERSTAAVTKETAIASATLDLPCDKPKVVGTDEDGRANAVEGCNLRVTYELIPFTAEGPAVQIGAATGFRYKLKLRSSLLTGPELLDGGR